MRRKVLAWLGYGSCLGLSVAACSDGVVTRGERSYGGSFSQGTGGGEESVEPACVIGGECETGQCVARKCVAAGHSQAGEGCETDADCARGLRCAVLGLGLACAAEGEAELGAACGVSVDCLSGLACLEGMCAVSPSGTPAHGTAWEGVACEEPLGAGIKAYFEVPGAEGAEEGDFFRLPFPTDVRRRNGQLDLSGFPTPGPGELGIDVVQLYVDAVAANDSGWSSYPTVLFRFSGGFDFATFSARAIRFFDITEPAEPVSLGWQRFYTAARTNYVCDNFLAVQPPRGEPLEPGHTYAVLVLSETLDEGQQPVTLLGADDHQPVVASQNLLAVLDEASPADEALRAAHSAFSPLREFFEAYTGEDERVTPANVLTASVFTVGEVRTAMADLAAAAAKTRAPTARSWVKCGGRAVSPCPQAEAERACGEGAGGYDEYHALLSIPVFQQGAPPYLTADDGGAIDLDRPHFEDVCLAITVPKGAPPADGFPAVVFAHGTGGNFRSHVRDEVAGVLAAADPPFAVIGIDQVEHGPRRGDSEAAPDELFFNLANPAASRGNPLQGAVDQLSLARFVKTLDLDAVTSTGAALKIDGSRLFFFGHSQGSTEGSLMLPFGDDYQGSVLSGNGASLREALQTKTKPRNIAAGLPLVLEENPRTSGPDFMAIHPVLALLQHWIDPADPLSFAALLREPLAGHRGKHVFQTFGIEDSYSPPETLETFALAARLTQVKADVSAEPAYVGSLPQQGIATVGHRAAPGAFTLGMRQYGAPAGRDGHFVVFDSPAANRDMVRFLTGADGSEPPPIGQ